MEDTVERGFYRPVARAMGGWGQLARGLQPGSVHRYLGYAFAAVIVVLVAVAVLA